MHLKRLVAGLVTAGLAAAGPVLIAEPAHAADNRTTATTLSLSETTVPYGRLLLFDGAVTDSANTGPLAGSASLQISTPANPTWTTISTDDSPGYLYFPDITAQSNASYKVVYTGGSYAGDKDYGHNYAPSESPVVTIHVPRSLEVKTAKSNRLKVIGKVTPDYAKKKVVIKQLVGKGKHPKAKKFKTVKTNGKGVFTFKAPNKRGWRCVIIVKGDAMFDGVTSTGSVS
jgi:hypothetical protein